MNDLTSSVSLKAHNALQLDGTFIMISLRQRDTEVAGLRASMPRQLPLPFIYEPPRDGEGFMKWCGVCGDWRPRAYFSPKADARDGLHPYCKECRNRQERMRYRMKRLVA